MGHASSKARQHDRSAGPGRRCRNALPSSPPPISSFPTHPQFSEGFYLTNPGLHSYDTGYQAPYPPPSSQASPYPDFFPPAAHLLSPQSEVSYTAIGYGPAPTRSLATFPSVSVRNGSGATEASRYRDEVLRRLDIRKLEQEWAVTLPGGGARGMYGGAPHRMRVGTWRQSVNRKGGSGPRGKPSGTNGYGSSSSVKSRAYRTADRTAAATAASTTTSLEVQSTYSTSSSPPRRRPLLAPQDVPLPASPSTLR